MFFLLAFSIKGLFFLDEKLSRKKLWTGSLSTLKKEVENQLT